jgi:hypothetical protein
MSPLRAGTGTTLVLRARPAGAATLDELARRAGVHPELARRLVQMGLVDPLPAGADAWPPSAGLRLARAVRLRRDLGLNYAGAMLACDLLDRIDELERRLRRYEEVPWTRAS